MAASAQSITQSVFPAPQDHRCRDGATPLVFWGLNLMDFDVLQDVRQVLNEGSKSSANPILSPRPGCWDGTRCKCYGTVFFDEDEKLFKMWYSGGQDQPDDIRVRHGSPRHIGYAISTDGVQWTRPEIGNVEYNGSRENNIVVLNAQAPAVFKADRQANPDKRYTMFCEHGMSTDNVRVLFSPDGLHWKEHTCEMKGQETADAHGHEPFCILYDPDAADPQSVWKGYSLCHVSVKGTYGGRAVGFYHAADPTIWQAFDEPILDASTGIESEIHLPHVAKMHDDYMMLYDAMEPWHDTQTEIAISRDGIHFQRVQNGVPIVRRGGPGDHDGSMLCVSPRSLFVHDNKIWWYYSASCNNYQTGPRSGRAEPWFRYICLVQWRLDGFAHLQPDAGAPSGLVQTVPFEMIDDCQLAVTFNIVASQPVNCELLDGEGQVLRTGRLPGGDHLKASANWDGSAPTLQSGKTYCLRLYLDQPDACLYSIRIDRARRATPSCPVSTRAAIRPDPPSLQWVFRAGGKLSGEPLVHEDLVYVGSWDGHVYAIDRHTGRQRWRFATNNAVTTGPAIAGQCLAIGSRDEHLYGVDARTGKELWRHHLGAGEDAIGSGSGNWVSCPPGVGHFKPGQPERFFVGSQLRRMVAINSETGKLCWEFPTFNWLLSRPIVVDYVVYFGSLDGYLYAVDAASGGLQWRYQVGRELVYSTTVRPGSVTTKAVTAQPVIRDNCVYFGAHDGFVHAVNAKTGERLWTQNLGQIITSQVAVAGDKVIVVAAEGLVAVLESMTGNLMWRDSIAATVHAAPLVHDENTFWVTPVNGRMHRYALDGHVVDTMDTGRKIRATPVKTKEGQILVATCEGNLLCLGHLA